MPRTTTSAPEDGLALSSRATPAEPGQAIPQPCFPPCLWFGSLGEGKGSPPHPGTLGLGARARGVPALAAVGGVRLVWIFEHGQASERGGFAGGCTSWF